MAKDRRENFVCPHCQAGYKVVRMRAQPGVAHETLHCRVCRQPLAAIEGDNVLKYFLVGEPALQRSRFCTAARHKKGVGQESEIDEAHAVLVGRR